MDSLEQGDVLVCASDGLCSLAGFSWLSCECKRGILYKVGHMSAAELNDRWRPCRAGLKVWPCRGARSLCGLHVFRLAF